MNRIIADRDNLDDRKRILYLLEKLPPEVRLAWLRFVCTTATFPKTDRRPVVAPGHTGLALECYFDYWMICGNFLVDADAALEELTRLVSGRSCQTRRPKAPRPIKAKRALPHDFLTCPKGK